MYKISIDSNGNILDQYHALGDDPSHLEVIDGVTWLESSTARDVVLDYWTSGAWATKTARPTIWSVWDGSAWAEDATFKERLQITVNVEKRSWRDYLLSSSDWTQLADSPLTDAKKAEWATYRVVLRDYPSNNTDQTSFDDLVWPSVPT